MSGRCLTEKGRRRQTLKRAKPCHHHKGSEIDGGKTKKSRIWYEGPPMVKVNDTTSVSTIHQER